MTLSPGARLGRYEVIELLGTGAMGEVYRARDTRLERAVALKILRADLGLDARRLARFEREAQVLASLNHPNVATLYGLEESTGTPALVLELVAGETLAERLAVAPAGLPIGEAIAIARQIAAALDAAHEHGVVHRDLKPANIALRADGTVKVLDFGLAKAIEQASMSAEPGSATVTVNAPGAVLGTPAYMSPEQARGLAVDKRTDIWAFGCVLYEMLAGKRAFAGEHTTDVVAKIIEREPDLAALPPATPATIRRLVARCLEKDARKRLRDIGDAELKLEGEAPPASAAARGGRGRAMLAGAGLAAVLAAVAALFWWPQPEARAPLLFTLDPPADHELTGAPVPSPSGDRFVLVATAANGESALWLRTLGSPTPRRIAGTEGALRPFWSPDGRYVGFGTDGSLKRVAPDGGPVQVIGPLQVPFTGAAWSKDGVIVYALTNRSGLHRVPAAGGTPEPVTALDAARGENSHRFPRFLPDGRRFLFTARAALPSDTAIYVGSLDSPRVTRVLDAQSPGLYAAPGLLLFVREGVLLAQRFDAATLELAGDVRALYDGISQVTQGAEAALEISADGTVLAWGADDSEQLVWFDRNGTQLATVGPAGKLEQVRLAPDDRRAAVVLPDRVNGNRDVWTADLSSGALTRLTSHPANDWFPVWSPDGAEVLYASDRDEQPSFYRTALAGVGNDELVFRRDVHALDVRDLFPTDWSADGRIVFHSFPQGSPADGLWLWPLGGDGAPNAVRRAPFTTWIGALSPDGRWLAYVSDESGRDDIYVRSLTSAAWFRVSADGGVQPRWRRDGRELFYLSADNRLMAATLELDSAEPTPPPQALFKGCGSRGAPWEYRYDVAADGNRSLWLCPARNATKATVAINWAPQSDF